MTHVGPEFAVMPEYREPVWLQLPIELPATGAVREEPAAALAPSVDSLFSSPFAAGCDVLMAKRSCSRAVGAKSEGAEATSQYTPNESGWLRCG